MNETLRKIVDLGLRAWLNYDVKLADSVLHTIESGQLLTLAQKAHFDSLCEDFAMTGNMRKRGKIKDPIDEDALAVDVIDVISR